MGEIMGFVSKHALTGGVQRHTGKLLNDGEYFSYGAHGFVAWGRDAFATEAEAIADAEQRRVKKIASLRRQIDKLERLTFPTSETKA